MNKLHIFDLSKYGALTGFFHFLKGVALYAAVGAVQYGISYATNFHPGTPEQAGILVVAGEILQGIWKWLKTFQDGVSVTTTVVSTTEPVVGNIV